MPESFLQDADVIKALYRVFLMREPDEKGLASWVKRLRDTGDFEETVASFKRSDEFKKKQFEEIWRSRTSNVYIDDVNTTDTALVQQLFQTTAQYWVQSGDDPEEVYFSVLSSSDNRKKLTFKDRARFIASGTSFIGFASKTMAKYGKTPLNQGKCLDFGCGVGRLVIPALKHFNSVIGVDFSSGHLDEMRRNVQDFEPNCASSVSYHLLETVTDLNHLPPFDYCYSYITLQHNTPPVMACILRCLLRALRPGGVAMIHMPIHHPFYSFSIKEYLASPRSGQNMEMHILPRENIREIAQGERCDLLDSFGYGGTRGVYSEVFAFLKP